MILKKKKQQQRWGLRIPKTERVIKPALRQIDSVLFSSSPKPQPEV